VVEKKGGEGKRGTWEEGGGNRRTEQVEWVVNDHKSKKAKGIMKVYLGHHTSVHEVIHRVKDVLKTYDQPHTTCSTIHPAHTVLTYHRNATEQDGPMHTCEGTAGRIIRTVGHRAQEEES